MKLVCIDNSSFEDYLTIGKEYSGLVVSGKGDNQDMFRIDMLDDGSRCCLFKTYRFSISELE